MDRRLSPFSRLGAYLTDLFFPPRCVGCDRAGVVFCPHCAQDVTPVAEPICAHCGRPQRQPVAMCSHCRLGERDALFFVRVATIFDDPLRPAIHALKYGGQPELAVPLARYLIAVAQQPPWTEILPQIDAVIPVPLHAQRLAERGYNQSALLAGTFARRMGLKMAEGWLIRSRQTRSQVGLSALDRQHNVADAFAVLASVARKRLLLIDDVFTTGATMTACAQTLRQAGAAAVYGLVLSTPAQRLDGSLGDS